ncbi:MAG TPA: hypothetical protein VEJ89_17135 [Myxococcaceae bacterium]|nr:hypothetical protein [Myxococcaceae bacterium]
MPAARIEAHGGYLLRVESLEGVDLRDLARRALALDGLNRAPVSLLVSTSAPGSVVRLAYDSAHTYGQQGALFYRGHHALASALSQALPVTVHAYVFDPDLLEGVATYGAGARVGGETVVYDELDLDLEELSDEEFEAVREAWPLGRLAQLLGLTRAELLRLPYAPGQLVPLEEAAP